mgnify:FL=1
MTEEDKGAYKYCKNCGRVLSPTYEAELCPTCEENQLFDKVRDYIRKNDVTEMQVAEHFGIPQKKVKAWIKEGRIEYKEDGDKRALVSIRCAKCGAKVTFGTLCSRCLKIMKLENTQKGKEENEKGKHRCEHV